MKNISSDGLQQWRRAVLAVSVLLVATLVPPTYRDAAVARAETDKSEDRATLMVAASTTQIADMARHIAGDELEVRSILAPGADPHTYVPTPGDARLVMEASLTLQNGLNLEGANWMAKLAGDAGKPLVVCSDGVPPLEMEYGGEPVLDPHAWFDPRNAAIYVQNITRAFTELDPPNAWKYEARAALYTNQLRALDAWIRAQVSVIPPQERVLVTSHDAFNYFCRAYKFNPANDYLSLAPVGWSTGAEVGGGMTPSSRARVVRSIVESGAKAVFVETSVNPKIVREIAREAGVRIGGELYSDSMGEAGSAAETYIGMMRENVLRIIGALTGKDGETD